MAAVRPVSGKRVVWVVFGGLALLTALAVYWFMTHAETIRRGELQSPPDPAGGAQR